MHPHLIEAFEGIHPAVYTFAKVNSIGPKTAHKLTQALKFNKNDPAIALKQLVVYCQKGKVRVLEGLGEKSEADILTNTLNFMGRKAKMPLQKAQVIATDVISHLKTKFPNLIMEPLGSLRRCSPLVGDIDIAIQSDNPTPIIEHFVNYPKRFQTITQGPKKASIRLAEDIRVDIMIQPIKSWGSLLQHFTGSKMHNIKLRQYARKLGYSISEYGVKEIKNKSIHRFTNETSLYRFLGLSLIPPEQRLGENEIEDAL